MKQYIQPKTDIVRLESGVVLNGTLTGSWNTEDQGNNRVLRGGDIIE